ncbi:MAG TPA: Hsp20/alpha crystallin family protein [Methanospirillum sp.]|nr:Hsp20/alpha crystallin family protein [Methanospirillum sp.]
MQNKSSQTICLEKYIEPSTSFLDKAKYLSIIIELPDIEEERIRIDLENQLNLVTIVATNARTHYKKEISLPCEVKLSKKRYADGILELTLEKLNSDIVCSPENSLIFRPNHHL